MLLQGGIESVACSCISSACYFEFIFCELLLTHQKTSEETQSAATLNPHTLCKMSVHCIIKQDDCIEETQT
jgi:hypothetical protein